MCSLGFAPSCFAHDVDHPRYPEGTQPGRCPRRRRHDVMSATIQGSALFGHSVGYVCHIEASLELRASFGYFGPSCPVWVMLRVWSHFGVSCPSLVILGRLVHFVSLLARFAVSFWLFSNIRSTVRQDIEISVPCVQLFPVLPVLHGFSRTDMLYVAWCARPPSFSRRMPLRQPAFNVYQSVVPLGPPPPIPCKRRSAAPTFLLG